jgi:site-specific DNA-methyltransferase (adenine-specific)
VDRTFQFGQATLAGDDCLSWFERQPANSLHGVVTDPPYGLIEYSDLEQEKLRSGRGGVWRIPPSFDGAKWAPLPRFLVRPVDGLFGHSREALSLFESAECRLR